MAVRQCGQITAVAVIGVTKPDLFTSLALRDVIFSRVVMQRLKRHVERRKGWRLFTDLIINWPGERDVAPAIATTVDELGE